MSAMRPVVEFNFHRRQTRHWMFDPMQNRQQKKIIVASIDFLQFLEILQEMFAQSWNVVISDI